MPYDVFLPECFKSVIKKYHKKYRHVCSDVQDAIELLINNPNIGIALHGFQNIRKLRVKNSDLGKGKSGGYRLIYLIEPIRQRIIPLLLYGKSNQDNVTIRELRQIIVRLEAEIQDINRNCN